MDRGGHCRQRPYGTGRIAFLLLVFVRVLPLGAHEIGTTRVDALLQPAGRFQVDVYADPGSVLSKLDARWMGTSGTPADEVKERIAALRQALLGRVAIRFDSVGVKPEVQILSAEASSKAPLFRLVGSIPPGAHSFSWSCALTYGTYALTVQVEDGRSPERVWLEGDEQSRPFAMWTAPTPSRISVFWEYLGLGFTHIVPKGTDHILFVLGIFLLNRRLRPLLAQVTAFTVAHSLTLGLTLYGVVSLSPRIVEPMIAVSIAYVAFENILTKEVKPWRVGVVFAFGLLHGMGFAGVLKELGLPRSEFLTALVSFNLGVEAGQLTVIATAFALFGGWFRDRIWYRSRIVVPASVVIALIATYWIIERVGV